MDITKGMIEEVLKVVSANSDEVKAALEEHNGSVEQAISFLTEKGLIKDTEGMTEESIKALDEMGKDSLEMIKDHRF